MKNSADLWGCYPPRPSASVDNTLLDLQNSSYPTRPHSIIANYTMLCKYGKQMRDFRGVFLAQWWESSLPTNAARVRFPDVASYVGSVCCWFSTLLREVFLRVLRFSPHLKNQHFQIPIRLWNARTFLNEFLWTPWCSVSKQITLHFSLVRKKHTEIHKIPKFGVNQASFDWDTAI